MRHSKSKMTCWEESDQEFASAGPSDLFLGATPWTMQPGRTWHHNFWRVSNTYIRSFSHHFLKTRRKSLTPKFKPSQNRKQVYTFFSSKYSSWIPAVKGKKCDISTMNTYFRMIQQHVKYYWAGWIISFF